LANLVLLGVTVPEQLFHEVSQGVGDVNPMWVSAATRAGVSAGGNRYFLSAPISAP
jgi:hypothetical protein